MPAWTKKLWHDPVWSKVISGLILAALLAVANLWSKSGFSTNAIVAWSAAVNSLVHAVISVWAWLAEPMNIPRGIAFALIIISAVIAVRTFTRLRRLVAEHSERIHRALIAEDALARELRQAKADILEMDRRWTAEQQRPRVIEQPEASLDNRAIQVLQQLYRWYPKGKSVQHLSMAAGQSFPVAEQTLDTLATLGLTKFVPVLYGRESYWVLTKKGRDYCLRNGLQT